MFQKALWLQTYKQSKYIVWLFWLVNFYILSCRYYLASVKQLNYFHDNMKWNYRFHYNYIFPEETIVIQGALVIILGCVIIGWERHNQSIELLWSMPFKRTHIFLTKWLFGVCNIISVLVLNWGIFAILKKTTFHNKYQIFSPFHYYFLYAAIVLVAIYTLTLCIGTIAGNIVSQGLLTTIVLILPFVLSLLIAGFISVHTNHSYAKTYERENAYMNNVEKLTVFSPMMHFKIHFNYAPQYAGTDDKTSKQINEPNYSSIPSLWTLISPILYTLILLPLSTYLYARSPNEQNGKILLFPKLQKFFIICTVTCFALLGARLLGGINSLASYYIGFLGTGGITYLILSRLLKWRFSLVGR
ncbi:ABC transporter permease subunit [Bacillus sp. WLY-B-L8]|uniref:ABC transporter permease subunit n=1 Tax=Bacillus multifaciens TaxID=3068506 RepID=UPI002740CF89|nr:ABC transporter permease subunit [Bacillus sp. WLY-B-L8]MDP7977008.1 ABC transporter permease subunit [Bacillus sp. WLY-B-L8]